MDLTYRLALPCCFAFGCQCPNKPRVQTEKPPRSETALKESQLGASRGSRDSISLEGQGMPDSRMAEDQVLDSSGGSLS